jgi:DNA mismatch repair protein MutS2
MDDKTLRLLELPKVLARLERYAAFSASKERARGLTPMTDLAAIHRAQQATREARSLLEKRPELTVGAAHDVRPVADRAARGSVLEPGELMETRSTLVSARDLARVMEKVGDAAPELGRLAAGLEIPPGLIEAISRVLDDRGEVRDSASEKLYEIRVSLRSAHDRLRSRLDRLVHDPKLAPMLQESIVTQRDGRFVLPLRAEFKGRLRSVIHDQSASGATLYIEPLEIVDLNNQVRELELAERDEVRRILTELSTEVGGAAESIRRTVAALAELDLALAKARYAETLRCAEPELRPIEPRSDSIHPGSTIRLRQARHPLLDPGQAVPIDLMLDDETFALVITGPNTGGKTVALKTAGLLALMAQCGLHLPTAPDSSLSVFESIFADIGDEQSIEQSLSTFSGHIAAIIQILDGADRRSLVVLDELGAGTDPEEGSALARAILATLVERGTTALVATHYPELKAFAHNTPGVSNASVEFDMVSLRPTYRLSVGLPGRSNALAIAERLGLDRGVVERAREMVAPDSQRAEGLLEEIRRQRERAEAERVEAEAARGEVEKDRAELKARLASVERERSEILEAAREEAAEEAEQVFRDAAELRRRLAGLAETGEAIRAATDEAEELASRAAPIRRRPPVTAGDVHVGDRVRMQALGSEGVVTHLAGNEAEVEVGRLRVRAALGDLTPSENPQPAAGEAGGLVGASLSAAPPPIEIDVRGLTVDEALDVIERQLDAASLAGSPYLRIIHGKGTGRLRQAIRTAMRDNPYVAAVERVAENEGGEGVTLIRLAGD